MKTLESRGCSGFTLIEVMIVAAMLAAVMAAIYSLFLTHQRSAYTQDEVVETQQNLRIAMDSITRDVRLAGFIIPGDDPLAPNTGYSNTVPVGAFSYNPGPPRMDTITLNAASIDGTCATIMAKQTGIATAFTVDAPETVDKFYAEATNGDIVRIIRPLTRKEPTGANGTLFRVTAAARGSATPGSSTLTLTWLAGDLAGNTEFAAGDLIVRTGSGAYPNTIMYCVGSQTAAKSCTTPLGTTCPTGQDCLARVENGIQKVIAANITSLSLSYIMDKNLPETNQPVDLSLIRAVRVTIIGQTAGTAATDGQRRTRETTSVIKMRNRQAIL